jgi:glycosyltransferase involved in cell wall biosynthesis
MKKVLFVISYSHLGGAETRAVDIAVNLKNNCVPVFIIYGKKEGAVQKILNENSIAYIERDAFNWKSNFRRLDVLYRLFIEVIFIIRTYYYHKPKRLISFCADANIFVSFANLFLQNKNTYWCQVDDFIQWRWKRLFLFGIRKSKNVIAVSEFITRQIKIKTGRDKNIITIVNSINPALLEIEKKHSEKFRLSVVGHINKIKNQGFVINAIADMIKRNKIDNIELNIYGMISDSSYWNEIKVDEDWFFYRGYQSKNEVYNNTDVLIIPSLSESFSLVLHEGNFFNLDILCSDITVFRESGIDDLHFFQLGNIADFELSLLSIIANRNPFNERKRTDYNKKYSDYITYYRKILTE